MQYDIEEKLIELLKRSTRIRFQCVLLVNGHDKQEMQSIVVVFFLAEA